MNRVELSELYLIVWVNLRLWMIQAPICVEDVRESHGSRCNVENWYLLNYTCVIKPLLSSIHYPTGVNLGSCVGVEFRHPKKDCFKPTIERVIFIRGLGHRKVINSNQRYTPPHAPYPLSLTLTALMYNFGEIFRILGHFQNKRNACSCFHVLSNAK